LVAVALLAGAASAIGAAAPKTEPQKKAAFNEPDGFSIYNWRTPAQVIRKDYW